MTDSPQGDGGHPDYLKNLPALTLDELRHHRKAAEKEEQDLSYVRRLLQGRADIVKAELARRTGQGEDLIEALPKILSDAPSGGSTRVAQSRFHSQSAPVSEVGTGEADVPFPDVSTANVATMTDDELGGILESLKQHERAISDGRAKVHQAIDQLSGELTRRYREGTAQVDDLLAAARRQ